MISSEENRKFKIILIGDGQVGKSCLISRFTEDLFSESYLPTIGFEDITTEISIESQKIQIDIVDSAGQERFQKETDYNKIQGVIIVYDVTNPDSFKTVEQHYKSIKDKSKDEKMKILLVGNKIDDTHNRKITEEQGLRLAKELSITYFETSAKDSQNVQIIYTSLVQQIIDSLKQKHDTQAQSNTNQKNPLFKIIIIGDYNVGKSSILLQKTDRRFKDKYEATIGVEFGSVIMQVNNCNCKLQIWDTAGNDAFRAITNQYYRGSHAFIIVYDVGNLVSFDHIPNYIQNARQLMTQDAKFILVGNKNDLEKREVSFDQGKSLADSYNIPFLEISAKNSNQVDEVFENLAKQLASKQEHPQKQEIQPQQQEFQPQQQQQNIQKQEPQPQSFLFKILLIGESTVGKTSLLLQYTDQFFSEDTMTTIGVDFRIRTLEVDKNKVKLQIWDTAGKERFKSITQSYYHGANAVIVVYDVGNEETLLKVPNYLKEIQKLGSEGCLRFLIGNKIDLENRQVSYEQGKSLADSNHIPFYETSAKDHAQVLGCFNDIAKQLVEARISS